MITLGSFTFPIAWTFYEITMIEAKSKVRKEIHLQSLLHEPTGAQMEAKVALARHMVEAFDRDEVSLSLTPGRYYEGRRREFLVVPGPGKRRAWLAMLLWTKDRFERSLTWHEQSQAAQAGRIEFSLVNAGNWRSPLWMRIAVESPISTLRVESAAGRLEIDVPLNPGQRLEIDTTLHLWAVDGQALPLQPDLPFPILNPGENTVSVVVTPVAASAQCTIRFQDYWV
ncbi:MAG: hypothetical protein RBU29_03150 [bacterium]|jgi:hypothetical protein|nr:hypothetical protein [bacterium]